MRSRPAGVSVGVGGQHHLGAALEHLGAHLVGVADDQLRAGSRALRRMSAPAPTPTSTGWYSLMNGLSALRSSAAPAPSATTTTWRR